MNEEKKVVCVTGATGYIASWIVKLLLERNYTVHATVRDPNDHTKVGHLLGLDGAQERLHLFKANLLEEGSFDSAISGCHGVFHTASPVQFTFKDPQTWYTLSKTLAEESAWKFAKENEIDLVSINPGMVIGPMLQPQVNASLTPILDLINGSKAYPNATLGWVHVKDVAMAHILGFEVPSAFGRYLMVETVIHFSDMVKIIQELYPMLKLPDKCADDEPFLPTYQVSKEKAKSLGVNFIPLKVTLKETIENLKEKGFASF